MSCFVFLRLASVGSRVLRGEFCGGERAQYRGGEADTVRCGPGVLGVRVWGSVVAALVLWVF